MLYTCDLSIHGELFVGDTLAESTQLLVTDTANALHLHRYTGKNGMVNPLKKRPGPADCFAPSGSPGFCCSVEHCDAATTKVPMAGVRSGLQAVRTDDDKPGGSMALSQSAKDFLDRQLTSYFPLCHSSVKEQCKSLLTCWLLEKPVAITEILGEGYEPAWWVDNSFM
ncbi:hypothetical protein GQ600_185 [Phytophthora cactorum]|nr:hypothetical protein GQ600_185 [Phytophthora cactorum]